MKKKIKGLGMVLSLGMLLSMLPMTVMATDEKVQEGKFQYAAIGDFDNDDVFYYSDHYFSQSGKHKNEHLRTMSANIAFAVNPSRENPDKNANIKKLLSDIGFSEEDMVFDDSVVLVYDSPQS